MAKTLQIGSMILTERKDGTKGVSLALGKKSKNSAYAKHDLSVEVTVKDSTGKVVAHQTDGFINLVDPRTQPDELLAAKIISEDTAAKMRENVSKLSSKVRYVLQMSNKS